MTKQFCLGLVLLLGLASGATAQNAAYFPERFDWQKHTPQQEGFDGGDCPSHSRFVPRRIRNGFDCKRATRRCLELRFPIQGHGRVVFTANWNSSMDEFFELSRDASSRLAGVGLLIAG